MSSRFTLRKLSIFFTAIFVMFLSMQITFAQPASLSLAEVLTGLQSQSGGFTMAEKNDFLRKTVLERGITFRLSTDIESELLRAGASPSLMSAIRTKAPRINTIKNVKNPAAKVDFSKIWVDYDVVEKGQKGMRIHNKFTVRNLKNVPLYMTVRIIKAKGGAVMTPANKTLEISKPLNPGYDNSVYSDYHVFVPYSQFRLPAGKHNLKVDADIFYQDKELLKHLAVHNFLFTQPGRPKTPTLRKQGSVVSSRIWIDYNVKRNGQQGMVVHTRMTLKTLKSRSLNMVVSLETAGGKKIMARAGGTNKAKNGQVAFYRRVIPRSNTHRVSNLTVFIPYREVNVTRGKHNLRLHVDVLDPGANNNLHVGFKAFSFTRP
ncbi:MAG: hypothetical protein HKN25_14350 [Pyrinomonadaceae bacterium]|nr:hypothetical protein [Pyrinomonadaceae bacterium]